MPWRFRLGAGMPLVAALFVLSSLVPAHGASPPFPRDAAKKVQESDRVTIWDVTMMKDKQYIVVAVGGRNQPAELVALSLP